MQIDFNYLYVNQILESTIIFTRLSITYQPIKQFPRQNGRMIGLARKTQYLSEDIYSFSMSSTYSHYFAYQIGYLLSLDVKYMRHLCSIGNCLLPLCAGEKVTSHSFDKIRFFVIQYRLIYTFDVLYTFLLIKLIPERVNMF